MIQVLILNEYSTEGNANSAAQLALQLTEVQMKAYHVDVAAKIRAVKMLLGRCCSYVKMLSSARKGLRRENERIVV
jgi:hypothetical protein